MTYEQRLIAIGVPEDRARVEAALDDIFRIEIAERYNQPQSAADPYAAEQSQQPPIQSYADRRCL